MGTRTAALSVDGDRLKGIGWGGQNLETRRIPKTMKTKQCKKKGPKKMSHQRSPERGKLP